TNNKVGALQNNDTLKIKNTTSNILAPLPPWNISEAFIHTVHPGDMIGHSNFYPCQRMILTRMVHTERFSILVNLILEEICATAVSAQFQGDVISGKTDINQVITACIQNNIKEYKANRDSIKDISGFHGPQYVLIYGEIPNLWKLNQPSQPNR
uniref:Uncharacterized protein n=1 Tax=Salvator merianae TaxID=96440 RepID=A0A8D0BTE2_SALMN